MNILLHTCCAPCAIYPLSRLRKRDISVTMYFFNPNIHPYKEYRRRLDCLISFCQTNDLPLIVEGDYQMTEFLRAVVFQEDIRCKICSSMRMAKTSEFAVNNGFDGFSTTLLYSRFQNHQQIKDQCQALSRESTLPFYYEDFREGWQYGIDASLEQGLYRQPYCGCIYSEQQRYDKSKRLKRTNAHVEDDSSGNKQ